ncbi:S-type pyocin domain-containing protein [Jinshanibacter sp. LJY008]|uniref:S-type pyocin domain-containing protein n=1 Tax=Limnobaculum eriocheiris TaxID=2897391 RepID=A0A9X1SKH7_9GAMM|nr:S-type pyocin domain-containing protein [Limnobaculum eriocheiris]MCD1125314.1 S-type pyocin domain-containing protein [Limnobaculum eriocheiris]
MATKRVAVVGDRTTTGGTIIQGLSTWIVHGKGVALDGYIVACGCPSGKNRIIAFNSQIFAEDTVHSVPSARQPVASNSVQTVSPQSFAEQNSNNIIPVFAKSCLRGSGCTDAGQERESIENFGDFSLLQSTDTECGYRCEPSSPAQMASVSAVAATEIAMKVIKQSAKSTIKGRWMSPHPVLVLLVGIFYTPEIGKGGSRDDLADYIARDKLDYLASTGGTATTRVRFQARVDMHTGQPVIEGYHTPEGSGLDQVPVIRMKPDVVNGVRRYIPEGNNGPTIIWTPAEPDYRPVNHTGNNTDYSAPPSIFVNPIPESQGAHTTTTPIPEERHFSDYILFFPTDSGMPPIYIMLDSPRNESGVVTGQGENIYGTWLRDAGVGLGCPVPAQIADKLRGREFANFDQFRKAFWIEVSKDTELSEQFSRHNQTRIKQGLSPRTIALEHIGKRMSFELHHINYITHGGAVYDVDNIKVMTPKNHIQHHKGNK